MSAESESADVFDFVDAYLGDLERGVERPLAHWLERFPRSQDAIAREWLALRRPAVESSAHSGATGARHTDGSGERVGPYRILRELGRGGQGAVYLAEDSRIARRVALKVLTTHFDSVSKEKRERFRREAAVIARLEHPGLCTIHDADLDGDKPWIAMRFVEGRTLAECLAEAKAAGGAEVFGLRLPPRTALELHAVLLCFERAARALHAAHEVGIVHRDIKPGNVILALDGRPVLLDFGLARDDSTDTGTLTQSGDVFGTPAYMSPEQLSLRSNQLDRRTDVYSLGATLYEALTLERPFDNELKSTLYRAIQGDPLPDPRGKNSALTEDIKVVLETALEKDRNRRYATALALAEDLRRIREYEPIHARPASVGLKFARWTRRHPALAVGTIGTILALSIGLFVTLRLLANEKLALAQKEAALSVALGKHLAQRAEALSVEDPPSAVLLGIKGVELAPGELSRSSLFTALESCWQVTSIGEEEAQLISEDIAVSPDSDLAAIAFNDQTIRLVTLERGEPVAVVEARAGRIVDMEFAASGARLMTATDNGTIEICDARAGKGLVTTRVEGPLTCARLSPDGSKLCVVGGRIGLKLLDVNTLTVLVDYECAPDEFTEVRFAPDGSAIAALKPGGKPAVFALAASERSFEVPSGGGANSAVFSAAPGALRLLVAGQDGALHVIDGVTGMELGPTLRFPLVPTSLVASADGVHVAVLTNRGEEGAAYLCNLETGSSIRLGPDNGRHVTQAAFSPDRMRLATTSYDLHVRTWDVAGARELLAFTVPRRQVDVAWSSNGERLLTRASGGTAQVWFARVRDDMFDLHGHSGAVRSAVFAPDGTRALTASVDKTARIWNVDPRSGSAFSTEVARLEHPTALRAAAYSADGRVVLTVGEGVEARTWDANDGKPLRDFARHPSSLIACALAPNGAHFATVCADGKARLWGADTDDGPIVVPGDLHNGKAVAFSLDSTWIALADERNEIRLHSVADGSLVRTIAFRSKPANQTGAVALAFRPGVDQLAVGCGDQRLRCFSATTGASTMEGAFVFRFRDVCFSRDGLRALATGPWGGGAVRSISFVDDSTRFPRSSHTDDITSACYSESAELVLTASKDRSVRIWKSRDGLPLLRREHFASAVLCVATSGALGEERVITGCQDGRVCVWPIDPLPAAHKRALPPLHEGSTRRERELAWPLEYR
ncbi:MAG: protein kinase [Planctomycetes bacterium]|nr:protein kinase [Planctomycetota bacterium]